MVYSLWRSSLSLPPSTQSMPHYHRIILKPFARKQILRNSMDDNETPLIIHTPITIHVGVEENQNPQKLKSAICSIREAPILTYLISQQHNPELSTPIKCRCKTPMTKPSTFPIFQITPSTRYQYIIVGVHRSKLLLNKMQERQKPKILQFPCQAVTSDFVFIHMITHCSSIRICLVVTQVKCRITFWESSPIASRWPPSSHEISLISPKSSDTAGSFFRRDLARSYTCVNVPESVFQTRTAPLAPEANLLPSGEKHMRSIGSACRVNTRRQVCVTTSHRRTVVSSEAEANIRFGDAGIKSEPGCQTTETIRLVCPTSGFSGVESLLGLCHI